MDSNYAVNLKQRRKLWIHMGKRCDFYKILMDKVCSLKFCFGIGNMSMTIIHMWKKKLLTHRKEM